MPEMPAPPPHPFEARLAQGWPPCDWKDLTVLAAVSGGGDSVALLCGLAAIRPPGEGRLIAAHVNHKLRGADSEADEAFVRQLCRRLGLACQVAAAAIDPAAGRGEGIEASARRARYAALEEMAGRTGARFVVTAHTAEDQAETVLHRVLRGTGVRGLGGMARTRRLGPATLLRPLLGASHAELLAYLGDRGQPYRSDASNRDLRFLRNRIRQELLPLLAKHYNPSIVAALLRLGELARESQTLIDTLVGDVVGQSLRSCTMDEVRLDVSALAGQSPHLVREVLAEVWRRRQWPQVAMGFAEWQTLAAMVLEVEAAGPRKRMFPGAVLAELRGGELVLSRSMVSP
jgi:tRNA(Ile)-lysidine synthase